MARELIISNEADTVRIALLEDGRLMELHGESSQQDFSVGDVYLAKVKRIAPGLNAAFVDTGYEKDAFLHYHDLGKQFRSFLKFNTLIQNGQQRTSKLEKVIPEPEIKKDGNISDALHVGQNILIQIAKEPISTKGPRITAELSIAGRYLILIPFSDKISISQKIKSNEERERLERLVSSIKPKGFGVIIRTIAKERKVAELHADMNYLTKKWNQCYNNLRNKKETVPYKILSEIDRVSSILRDRLSADTTIICDDETFCEEISTYVKSIRIENETNQVSFYNKPTPLFEFYNIDRQIKAAFGRTVNLPKGAYLIVEHTEALHVIDVNSGNSTGKKGNQEENALMVNKFAATEIARQLRLRDMGGIIVVDFIDMANAENRRKLYAHFREAMQQDKAKHKILPPSKFGLIQVTRQRVRPEINIQTDDDISQQSKTPFELVESFEETLVQLVKENTHPKIYLHVHPFVAAYLKQGFPSIQHKWFLNHKKWVSIIPRSAYTYLEYHFFDSNKKEITHP